MILSSTNKHLDINMTLDNLEIEKKIGDVLFKQHGRVLENGYVDGIHVGLEFIEEISGGKANSWSYSRKRNGKIQVRVGKDAHWVTGDNSVGFKQLKTGGYNYDKIAAKLVDMADYVGRVLQNRVDTKSKADGNRKFIDALEEENGLCNHSSGLDVSAASLQFKTRRDLTREQGEAFVLLAIELGLVTKKRKTI